MSYRLNFTGRKRIPQNCISISLRERHGAAPEFDAEVRLPPDIGLPADAKVYVEPYVKSSSMRFCFGTAGDIQPPVSRVLSEVDAGASILFRVKVVDESNEVGKILAAAHGIRPKGDEEGDDRKPLLPLRTMDLGEEMWRLEVSSEAGPELQVNNRLPELADQIRGSCLLQGAVFPEVIRLMVRSLLSGVLDDDLEWVSDWKVFLADCLGDALGEDTLPEDADEREEALRDLANVAAANFATRHRFVSRMSTESRQENE